MLNISSIFSPLNWFRFIFNPLKGIKVLFKIISDYPRLQKLLIIKNKFLRRLILKFYTYLVSKNKFLNFFFLKNNEKIDIIHFDISDLKYNKKDILNSLAYNGIIFIRNALSEDEKNIILSYFNEVESGSLHSKWVENKIINAADIKDKTNENDVNINYAKKKLEYLPGLKSISDYISSSVFGESVDSDAGFFVHNSKKIESKESFEDTKFHIDRYLPCLKIIYSPEEIRENHGPFGFVKTTHKINHKKINEYLLNSNKDYIDTNKMSDLIENKAIKATCNKNTIIIAFTNGVHKRNVFLESGILRKTVFLQYTNNFNRLSLFNYFKYNKKKLFN